MNFDSKVLTKTMNDMPSTGNSVNSTILKAKKEESRPSKAELLQLKLIHLFARELLLIKKLQIEKTKPTFIISVLKVEY